MDLTRDEVDLDGGLSPLPQRTGQLSAVADAHLHQPAGDGDALWRRTYRDRETVRSGLSGAGAVVAPHRIARRGRC